ncbi:MAG: NAD(P)H-dependent glycerol-3-phosphate dehydrogenase [Dehalococcoidales bacterium]|nr:NAD(P)H-dependent glycerol-3-phosphate dehydrogenase [Dehalococcoidales bacterium]
MVKIAVIGTTSWGTTLGMMLARKDIEVRLWARTEKEAKTLRNDGPSATKFPDVVFPPQVTITSQMGEAVADTKAVILAVPSQTMRQNARLLKKHLTKSTLVISAAKGLEIGSNKRMSEVIAEEISPRSRPNICVLSGPNLSQEIMRQSPAATVVAAEDEDVARKVQRMLTTPYFCVFTNTDVIGVELGGALKNIIALGAGVIDGLGYGDNAKAAFVTRGLTEITALGVAMGANPLTFSGLAGLGDLIATCASSLSRNHYVGFELAKGRSLAEIMDSMNEVAEGVGTTLVAYNLAQQLGLGMPITEKLYRVLYKNADLHHAAKELMEATTRHELSGRKWRLFSLFKGRKIATKG